MHSAKLDAKSTEQTALRFTAADLCFIAVFAAVISVMAQISIPLPGGVPLTLQTLAVPLAGIILGPKRGTAASLIYVLLAAAGAPVLAGFTGGLGKVFGMTGGFIFSFPVMAWAAGLGANAGSYRPSLSAAARAAALWAGLILGAVINYAVGTAWFMFVAQSTLAAALAACVLPFVFTSVIKIILAGLLGPMLKQTLMKAGIPI